MSAFAIPNGPVLQALAIIGALCGALGCFAILRRQSLLGDTLAHASLPGVCLAYMVTGSKSPMILLLGAMAAGLTGTLLVLGLLRGSRLKQDTALGIILSTFFGFGIVLLTMIQNLAKASSESTGFTNMLRKLLPIDPGTSNQSGLDKFIYGQAAYLGEEHVWQMLWFALGVGLVLVLFYKEFKLISFDPDYASTLGFRRKLLEVLLSFLIVIAVMLSLRAVGVVLTVALLIAPAAAARQWTHRLGVMIALAMLFGIIAGEGGAFVSQNFDHTPAGPAIVLVASSVLGFSLLLAPRRGVVWNWLRQRSHRRTVRRENLLADFYRLGEREHDWTRNWTPAELAAVRGQQPALVLATVKELQTLGLVQEKDHRCRLTEDGLHRAARVVRNHRLWELYLTRRLELASDHVHRDAEDMEHTLPPEVVAELEASLENPEIDPHGHRIPRES